MGSTQSQNKSGQRSRRHLRGISVAHGRVGLGTGRRNFGHKLIQQQLLVARIRSCVLLGAYVSSQHATLQTRKCQHTQENTGRRLEDTAGLNKNPEDVKLKKKDNTPPKLFLTDNVFRKIVESFGVFQASSDVFPIGYAMSDFDASSLVSSESFFDLLDFLAGKTTGIRSQVA